MKRVSSYLAAVVMLVAGSSVPAATLFVNVNSTNPVTPYASWSTAATNIQDAIDASTNGDLILVTNGVYATGGRSMDGVITNRVSLNKAITVQSINGAQVTIIQGAWDPVSTNGPGAIRCAWLTNNATLSGFTLSGGATRSDLTSYQEGTPTVGGGVFGYSNSIVANCTIKDNAAASAGGGADGGGTARGGIRTMGPTLTNCQIIGNSVLGVPGYGIDAVGGGADGCNLKNCTIISNYALSEGGGTAYGFLKNCAVTSNSAGQWAGGVYYGTLVNCTVTRNSVLESTYDYGGGAYYATLINCIVYANRDVSSYQGASNYYNCTFSFSCSAPLPSGSGNIGVDPQLLADGVHLATTSPCIGAGTNSVVSGSDIDGQSWNDPPSIGCDEWHPAPVIGAQPSYQINSPAYGLTFNVLAAGESPFNYFWSHNGVPIQDDGHYSHASTANMTVNHFGPDDGGLYQVMVSNAFGVVTSQVVQVVIHTVDAAGNNPVSPYSTWATAATNIQDAISASVAGDIVLVTNGIYANGGKVMGGVSNRIVLDNAVTVQSVNGPFVTTIRGAWDPVSTNGPDAIRCAWLTNGALLNGFTLENGATETGGSAGASDDSGGGVYCASTNAVVANCFLTNNSSVFGGGICGGILNNSLVAGNLALYGGGAFSATLNNCKVVSNYFETAYPNPVMGSGPGGGGTYDCVVQNSIVLNNYWRWSYAAGLYITGINNYSSPSPVYSYSCTYPLPSGAGNIDGNSAIPQFLDLFHIASTSPCCGAGSSLYASGSDLDGEPWANPPSMGCDEVVLSNLTGPLSVDIQIPAYQTNWLVNRLGLFLGSITGHAAYVTWSFGDGPTSTNLGVTVYHTWTNAGDYSVTFTAFNEDNPAGVSTNIIFPVLALNVPQLQLTLVSSNGFQFQFPGQLNADYTIQYTTNLAPPVTWRTLQIISWNVNNVIQINDSAPTNAARFYRVLAQ